MRRKDEQKANGGNGNGRVKAFVFGFELEGSDDVLAEGIKAFTTAMSKGGVVLASVATPTRPGLGSAKPGVPAMTLEAEEPGQSETIAEITEVEAEVEDSGDVANNSGPKRQYNYHPPQFKDDLDLTKATKPLVDFMAEKASPKETNDRYIVIAVWLREHMQIEEFTIDHIYTAFDNLGWKAQMPVNHSQPLRDLKTKRHFLTREKGAAGYKVNWQGIQYVAKMGATNS